MSGAPQQVRGIRLGSINGAQVIVQPSTLLMLVLLAWIYSSSGAAQVTANAFSYGMLLAVLLFVSVFLHELAHAIAAWAYGRRVSAIVLTLWGGHTSFDARKLTPGVVGVTAIAGPAANVLIAIGGSLVANTGLVTGTPAMALRWVVYANILLAVFNVIPGIPMDGGKVLQSVVWAATGDKFKGLRVAGWAGRVLAIAIAVLAIAYPLALGEQVSLINVAFAILLFSVIWPAASSAIKAVDSLARRESASVRSLMRPALGVPYTASVADARAAAISAGVVDVVVLAADGTPAAIANLPTMDRVPLDLRENESLQTVTVPLPRGAVVGPALDGEELITTLRDWYGRTNAWAVADGETVVGVVVLEEVIAALQ